MLRLTITVLILLSMMQLSIGAFILDNGIGLKGMQYGGAYTADPERNDAVYWNAAQLINLNDSQLYISYFQKYTDATDMQFIYNIKLWGYKIGIAWLQSKVDNILYLDSSGNPVGTGTVQYIENAYMIGVGLPVNQHQSFGMTVKSICQEAVDKANYQALDLFYAWSVSDTVKLGAAARNIIHNAADKSIMPVYTLACSGVVGGTRINMDYLWYTLYESSYINLGLGYPILQNVQARIGTSGYSGNIYGGITISFQGLEIDYLFNQSDIEIVHQVGLGISL